MNREQRREWRRDMKRRKRQTKGTDMGSMLAREKWQIGIFTDVAAQMTFQFKEHLNLHAGYQMLFFSGLAVAPEQVEKKTHHQSNSIRVNGTAIIHGLFVGLTVSF